MNFFKDLKDEIENEEGELIVEDAMLDSFSEEDNFDDFDLSSEDAMSLEEELLAKMELEEDLLSNEEETVVEEAPVVETVTESKVDKPEEKIEEKVEIEKPPVQKEDSEKMTVISKGTVINGSIISDGSLEVHGTVNGDITCLGKLTLYGNVKGKSDASEVYVNTRRVDGGIDSKGAVKIDVGTVVIGNVSATSCVVAGAVKGDFDVSGPVIVDSTAVIKGNISSKGIQINSGAVVDGYCTPYSDVDIESFFGDEEKHE